MARTTVTIPVGPGRTFVPARLPAGVRTPASGKVQQAIADMEERQRISGRAGCVIVFFRGKRGKLVAVQRCEGRKLKAHNRRQCRGAKKKFVKCGRGRRRGR